YSRPIHVSVVDDQFPVAVNDTAEVLEDSSVTIRILDNDSDPDGDTLIISDVTVPVHGTAVIDTGDISITYAPASDFFGQDTCSYVIHDGKGLLDTGEVFITVTPVNDPPVITSLVAAVATEDVYFIYRATATDVEGDSLSWTFDWRPGWLQFNADSVFGTPLEGATDTSFRAIVADSTLSDTLVVYLSVVAVNDPPEPFALLLPVDGDTVEIVNDSLLFVWESSADIEGDTLTYTFHIEGPGYDTTIADLTDTCLVLTGMAALSLDSLYTWSVDAFDETDTTSCLVEFQFIMPSTLGTDPLAMIPQEYALHQNYPNPFNPVSTIRYELPQASEVSLVVYDILGREVTKLVDGYLEQGYHQVQWDGRNSSGRELPSGIYIARLVIPPVAGQKAWGYSKSIKMVLLK
ncbi:MAG: cadherin-like domain-containing protein, partial [Fidelibacterota bacterium]